MPRTTTATRLRAACRCAFITPTEQTTLSMPVSSSRLRNVAPMAVPGRCRCVTSPRRARGDRARWSAGRRPRGSRPGAARSRRCSSGCRSGETQVAHRSARVMLDLAHPRQRRRPPAPAWCRAGARPARRTRRPTAPGAGRAEASNAPAVASASSCAGVSPARRDRSVHVGERRLGARRHDPLGHLAARCRARSRAPGGRPARRRGGASAVGSGVPGIALGALEVRPAALVEAGGRDGRVDRAAQRLEAGLRAREHQVGTAHLDAVPAGVADQRLRRVEAHRLVAQQPGEERRRVVQLEPRAGVDEQREAERVRLGEAEVREGQDLDVDRVGLRRRPGRAAPSRRTASP